MAIYDYSFKTIDGLQFSLADYKGKVLIITNTASKCGFTPQYKGLEDLYTTYKEKGLIVIGFPCNQFGDQEPGTNTEVKTFCEINYGISFPLSMKVDVREDSADPIFKYLTSQTTFTGIGKGIKNKALELFLKGKYGNSYSDNSIKWNFTKFLVDRDGKVVRRFEPTISPESMISDIERCL